MYNQEYYLDELDLEDDEFVSGELFDEEFEFEFGGSMPFSEQEELELATELLMVNSDEELEQFLGKVFKKIKRGIRKIGRSKIFRKIGGVLKKVAKKALPIAGGAIGTFFGGPVGGAIGGKLGSFASNLFEMELEGLSPEDQELEVARRFVRFAGASAELAARMPGHLSEDEAAKTALKKAASRHAPGLMKNRGISGRGKGSGRSGRWMRKGRSIIVLGA